MVFFLEFYEGNNTNNKLSLILFLNKILIFFLLKHNFNSKKPIKLRFEFIQTTFDDLIFYPPNGFD